MQKIVGITVPCSVIVVTLLLVFLLAPIQASAMGYDISLDPFNSGGIQIYDYNNKTENPEIPEEMWYLGAMRPVTSIGNYAFYNCDSLTGITIPDSVTTIGYDAFSSCDSLTSVTIGDSVTTIGEHAFYSCDRLTSIVIPDSVTTVGNYAFEDCDSLASVTIGDSVTSIDYFAFYGCDSLTSIVIPDSVTIIYGDAFYGCTSLTDVYFTGTKMQWEAIDINYGNEALENATIHYNYVPEQN